MIYSMVIFKKADQSSRVENKITYFRSNRGGVTEHNIQKYNSKVVYFQNTTISKTSPYAA